MSYNSLDFAPESQGYEDSIEFMEHICIFFQEAKYLTHINFSGMNFGQE